MKKITLFIQFALVLFLGCMAKQEPNIEICVDVLQTNNIKLNANIESVKLKLKDITDECVKSKFHDKVYSIDKDQMEMEYYRSDDLFISVYLKDNRIKTIYYSLKTKDNLKFESIKGQILNTYPKFELDSTYSMKFNEMEYVDSILFVRLLVSKKLIPYELNATFSTIE